MHFCGFDSEELETWKQSDRDWVWQHLLFRLKHCVSYVRDMDENAIQQSFEINPLQPPRRRFFFFSCKHLNVSSPGDTSGIFRASSLLISSIEGMSRGETIQRGPRLVTCPHGWRLPIACWISLFCHWGLVF